MSYTNYQLPQQQQQQYYNSAPSYGQEVDLFASPPPPQQQHQQYYYGSPAPATSTELVPSYGPPSSSYAMPPAQATPPQVSPSSSVDSNDNVDPAMAAIVASQERALAEARKSNEDRKRHPTAVVEPRDTGVPGVDYAKSQRNSRNITEAIVPNKYQMKAERSTKTVAGATGGAVLGGIILAPVFPVGMMLGGAAGGYAANKLSKSGERRAQRRYERQHHQEQALHSSAINAAYV
eukprot:Nitzschia sp. Nitz4//scaffold186_size43309//2183//2887//NITZ4_007313-RA/size43309-processed-gene-0.6-mRNA-1//-1//CDS//3329539746//582//frame0